MSSWSQTESVTSNRCGDCNRPALAADNFCRWCGFNFSESPTLSPEIAASLIHKTTALGNEEESRRSVSARSLNTLQQGVAATTGPLRLNRFGALVIAVLIAIPMWLLIILLSPFDAYVSARTAFSQMDVR